MTDRSRLILRRIGAGLAGLLFGAIAATLVDVILHSTSVFPPWGQPMSDNLFLLATSYRLVFNVASCYIAARLAPDKPMQHAMTLGYVGAALSAIATIATWNKGPSFGPHWYPIGLAITAIPCAWVGGKLFLAQQPAALRGEALG
jgi:hypothetical protein